ncbi:MAG TPA: phosphate-starvation-inducible PsiE family protein, partial [Candidatus Latescibacteria bacterium]|nr:phosphate-starvation-inducible PsiE family protein [Candidatus Latescibacterota bacterium]
MHGLKSVINGAVRLLAILMTLVIVWGVLDVLLVLVKRLMEPPIMRLQIADILATFGSFMAVLIAIEIFVNITIYLRDDIIHVKIVMATALMAIARKVIILNVEDE